MVLNQFEKHEELRRTQMWTTEDDHQPTVDPSIPSGHVLKAHLDSDHVGTPTDNLRIILNNGYEWEEPRWKVRNGKLVDEPVLLHDCGSPKPEDDESQGTGMWTSTSKKIKTNLHDTQ
jgi:hypothetical protein